MILCAVYQTDGRREEEEAAVAVAFLLIQGDPSRLVVGLDSAPRSATESDSSLKRARLVNLNVSAPTNGVVESTLALAKDMVT